jgi:hypothetical protein
MIIFPTLLVLCCCCWDTLIVPVHSSDTDPKNPVTNKSLRRIAGYTAWATAAAAALLAAHNGVLNFSKSTGLGIRSPPSSFPQSEAAGNFKGGRFSISQFGPEDTVGEVETKNDIVDRLYPTPESNDLRDYIVETVDNTEEETGIMEDYLRRIEREPDSEIVIHDMIEKYWRLRDEIDHLSTTSPDQVAALTPKLQATEKALGVLMSNYDLDSFPPTPVFNPEKVARWSGLFSLTRKIPYDAELASVRAKWITRMVGVGLISRIETLKSEADRLLALIIRDGKSERLLDEYRVVLALLREAKIEHSMEYAAVLENFPDNGGFPFKLPEGFTRVAPYNIEDYHYGPEKSSRTGYGFFL